VFPPDGLSKDAPHASCFEWMNFVNSIMRQTVLKASSESRRRRKMPWTKRDYPASMQNLPTATRNKAIEIANALLRDGYEEGRASATAQALCRARAPIRGEVGHPARVRVEPPDRGWAVRSDYAQRAAKV